MTSTLEDFALGLSDLGFLAAMMAVAGAFTALGAFVGGRNRVVEADLVTGWAAAVTVLVLVGVASTIPLSYVAWPLLAASVPAGVLAFRRDGRLFDSAMARILVLCLPLLVMAAAMSPAQWDDLTHWLPNARYLFDNDTFPRVGYPEPVSALPGYPYGLPLVVYLTSRAAGSLAESAGAMFNLLLLVGFALLIARLIRMAQLPTPAGGRMAPTPRGSLPGAHGWTYCALGGLAVTMLNPTFVTKLVFTSYADSATSVVLGFGAVLGWWMLNALADGDEGEARRLAWQLGLAATALIALKDSNPVLLAALMAGIFAAALRDGAIPLRRLWPLLPRILVLPILVYAAWRLHFVLNISVAHPDVRPFDKWNVELLPQMIERMLLVVRKKGGYFGVMLVALVFAGRAMLGMRGAFDRLAVIAAVVFVGFNAFLLFAYVAVFGEFEGGNVASFWRYNTQLGGIAVAFGAYGLALLWRDRVRLHPRPIYTASLIALIVVLPIALSHKVRFDRMPAKRHVWAQAPAISRSLPSGARLAVLDPTDGGGYLVLLRYALYGSVNVVAKVTRLSPPTAPRIVDILNRSGATHAWVRIPSPAVERALNVPLPQGSSYLVARNGGHWSVLRSWPAPDSRPPSDAAD